MSRAPCEPSALMLSAPLAPQARQHADPTAHELRFVSRCLVVVAEVVLRAER